MIIAIRDFIENIVVTILVILIAITIGLIQALLLVFVAPFVVIAFEREKAIKILHKFGIQ